MIRRPPRSTLLSLHDALPISRAPTRARGCAPPPRRGSARSAPPRPCDQPGARRVSASLDAPWRAARSEEHTSELQSRPYLVCPLLLEKNTILQSIYHTSNPTM